MGDDDGGRRQRATRSPPVLEVGHGRRHSTLAIVLSTTPHPPRPGLPRHRVRPLKSAVLCAITMAMHSFIGYVLLSIPCLSPLLLPARVCTRADLKSHFLPPSPVYTLPSLSIWLAIQSSLSPARPSALSFIPHLSSSLAESLLQRSRSRSHQNLAYRIQCESGRTVVLGDCRDVGVTQARC